MTHKNVDIQGQQRVNSPANSVEEADEGEGEGHVLHTLRRNHQFLQH